MDFCERIFALALFHTKCAVAGKKFYVVLSLSLSLRTLSSHSASGWLLI